MSKRCRVQGTDRLDQKELRFLLSKARPSLVLSDHEGTEVID